MEPIPQPTEAPVRWLRRLGRDEFARLMGASIESVLARHGGCAPVEARRLRWEVLRRFSTLLAARTQRVRALTKSECLRELERTHGALLRERARQGSELARLESELALARGSAAAGVLTPAEDETLTGALAADLEALLASPAEGRDVRSVLERERARRAMAFAGALERERERVDLLERRLAKLRAAQREMERALAELARRAEIDGGLPSIYRAVQGLDAGEPQREAKQALLTRIFEQNVALQRGA